MRGVEMKRANNNGVIHSWKAGEAAVNGKRTLSTDGESVYSYDLKIGHRIKSGVAVLGNYTASGKYYSQTTSRHVGRARAVADLVWMPVLFENTGAFEDKFGGSPF